MRKYQFKKQRLAPFVKRYGFTLAVGIGVLGLGLAVWSAVDAVRSTEQVKKSVGQVVSDVTDNRTPSPTVTPTATPSATPAPTATPKPTINPTPTPRPYPAYFIFPVNGTVTNAFSDNLPAYSVTMNDWRVHNGVDIEAAENEAVRAVADGVVLDIYQSDAWGTVAEINHGGGLTARYCHLNEEVKVAIGDELLAGEEIGTVGKSGYEECNENPHLHLEMTFSGKKVDPITVMKKSA